MIVRLKNNIVAEIIPEYALPVADWYGAEFAALCVEAPDDVAPGWVYDGETFSPPIITEPEPSETEKLRADVDFLLAMGGYIE